MMIKSLSHDPGLPPPWAWDLKKSNGLLAEVNSHDCIQTGKSPRVSGEDGCWAVAGALAGTRSFFEERPVYLSEVLDGTWVPT